VSQRKTSTINSKSQMRQVHYELFIAKNISHQPPLLH